VEVENHQVEEVQIVGRRRDNSTIKQTLKIMSDYYILNDDHTTTPCEMMVWAKWLSEDRKRVIVKQDIIGEVKVSTVFLGLNHAYLGQGAPLIFETMIFGGPEDGYQDRCTTWQQAEKMHETALKLLEKEK
jgi:hypothetical protein